MDARDRLLAATESNLHITHQSVPMKIEIYVL